LRNIFDKIGVSDRLELALFVVHHRMLAQATASLAVTPGRTRAASATGKSDFSARSMSQTIN